MAVRTIEELDEVLANLDAEALSEFSDRLK